MSTPSPEVAALLARLEPELAERVRFVVEAGQEHLDAQADFVGRVESDQRDRLAELEAPSVLRAVRRARAQRREGTR